MPRRFTAFLPRPLKRLFSQRRRRTHERHPLSDLGRRLSLWSQAHDETGGSRISISNGSFLNGHRGGHGDERCSLRPSISSSLLSPTPIYHRRRPGPPPAASWPRQSPLSPPPPRSSSLQAPPETPSLPNLTAPSETPSGPDPSSTLAHSPSRPDPSSTLAHSPSRPDPSSTLAHSPSRPDPSSTLAHSPSRPPPPPSHFPPRHASRQQSTPSSNPTRRRAPTYPNDHSIILGTIPRSPSSLEHNIDEPSVSVSLSLSRSHPAARIMLTVTLLVGIVFGVIVGSVLGVLSFASRLGPKATSTWIKERNYQDARALF